MTDAARPEKRRYPRFAPIPGTRLSVPTVHDVEVADISQNGVLFWCRNPFHVGQRAQIRALLDREPFTASIEVVRLEQQEHSARTDRRHRVGARFVSVDDNSQRNLQRFLVLAR
jgi:c-di-GMP-binding flagellar brake protein YcgR